MYSSNMQKLGKDLWKSRYIYMLVLPAFVYISIFSYYPIVRGFLMSIQKFSLAGESRFVGFLHYRNILLDGDFWKAFANTITIGGGNIVASFFVQILIALLLNEVRSKKFKGITQTVIYFPHLFSWVVVGGIWITLLAPDNGLVNELIKWTGNKPIYFMASEKYAQSILILLYVWRNAGYGCIIYLAAITNIDTQLYEAAYIDGAGRLKQTFAITLPGLYGTMKVVLLLNLMGVLNIFDQAYVMTNAAIINKTDVIMTYTHRLGILKFKLDYASAAAFIILAIVLSLTLIYEFSVKSTISAKE